MTKLLLLFTAYILNNPAIAEPLHGYLNDDGTPITYATLPPSYDLKLQQTTLQGSVSDDGGLYSTWYLVTRGGLVIMAIRHHPGYGRLRRGDRILTIDGHPFNLATWTNMLYDTNYELIVKRKGELIAVTEVHLTPLEYEQNK